MKVKLICPQIKRMSLASLAFDEFEKKINFFAKFELKTFKIEKQGDPNFKKKSEAEKILKLIDKEKDYLVALDEKGESLTSKALSLKTVEHCKQSGKNLCFIIGGPFGLDSQIKSSVHRRVSLSPLTFTSEIAITLSFEQVYRILSIEAGHPYHNE